MTVIDTSRSGGLLARVPDRPLVPAALALLLAVLFVFVRLVAVGDGDPGSFVGAGDLLSSGTSLPLVEGAGYDGQFYFRMATAPLNFDDTAAGVTFDSDIRLQRIGYPALAWLFSLGGLLSVSGALIAVNVVGLAVIAFLGGVFAKRSGRHALWGLTIAFYYGFAFTISKDLTEIVEVAVLLAALLAARHERFIVAALALSFVVLTRESAMFIFPAIAVWRLVDLRRNQRRPGRVDLTWILPPLVFGVWQLIIRSQTGRFAVFAPDRSSSFHVPGWPLIRSIPELLDDWSPQGVLHLAEVAVLVGVVAFAVWSLRGSTVPPIEVAVFAGLVLAMLSVDVGIGVWTVRSLRIFADTYAMAALVLLVGRKRLGPMLIAVAAVSVPTFGHFATHL